MVADAEPGKRWHEIYLTERIQIAYNTDLSESKQSQILQSRPGIRTACSTIHKQVTTLLITSIHT